MGRESEARQSRAIQLEIDPVVDAVPLVGVATHRLACFCGAGEDVVSSLELCVVEILNNIVRHAFRNTTASPVKIRLCFDADHVSADFIDRGDPVPEGLFAREPVMHVPGREHIESLPTGGMGLFIVKSLADEITYKREAGVNHVRLIKRLPDSSSTS